MRTIVAILGLAAVGVAWTQTTAGELRFGCLSRPACGKVCKLVCDTKTLTAAAYGCECDTICIPGPSQRGCKHGEITCCRDSGCCRECGDPCGGRGCRADCAEKAPKIEFCWCDWFACGCAQPRTVRVLTKYTADREICSYHWEVVDACGCGCPVECGVAGHEPGCRCVYKAAPPNAQIGDELDVLQDELAELAAFNAAHNADRPAEFRVTRSDRSDGQVVTAAAESPVLPRAPNETGPVLWRYMTKSLWHAEASQ